MPASSIIKSQTYKGEFKMITEKKKRKDSRFTYFYNESGEEIGLTVCNKLRGKSTWFYHNFIEPNHRGLTGKDAVMDKIKRYKY